MKKNILSFIILLLPFLPAFAQKKTIFKVIPLGVKGGSDESNLSSYAIAVKGTEEYICLDAGTINYGVQKAIAKGIWKGLPEDIIKTKIKGYLISHPHLDHLSGLITNSPDDSSKPIYGLGYTLDVLKENYFTWKSWANFGNEGEKPALGKYHYTLLEPRNEMALENTSMLVTAFSLSHSTTSQSTAFLIRHNEDYLLYLGDTGADETEKSDKLSQLWGAIGPLIANKKLKGMFIEVSFSNEQPNNLLFGHFTPKLLMQELSLLSKVSGEEAIKNFPIVITHMKPSGNREKIIKQQLNQLNKPGVKLLFAEQAHELEF
jgi:cAMP phosphodiesterase